MKRLSYFFSQIIENTSFLIAPQDMGCGLLSSNELGFEKGRDPGGGEHKGWLGGEAS